MSTPQLVGRLGVVLAHLVGGPRDGERKWTVVGAPIVVRLKRKEPPKPETYTVAESIWYSGNYVTSTEGDEWKDAKGKKPTKKVTRAVYAPRPGKPGDVLYFEGVFETTEDT